MGVCESCNIAIINISGFMETRRHEALEGKVGKVLLTKVLNEREKLLFNV